MLRIEKKNYIEVFGRIVIIGLIWHLSSDFVIRLFHYFNCNLVKVGDPNSIGSDLIFKRNLLISIFKISLQSAFFCGLIWMVDSSEKSRYPRSSGWFLGIQKPKLSDLLLAMQVAFFCSIPRLLKLFSSLLEVRLQTTSVYFLNAQAKFFQSHFSLRSPFIFGAWLIIGCLGPIQEELFFRGFVIQELKKTRLHGWAIIVVQAVWFSLCHVLWGSSQVTISTFVLGLLWGGIHFYRNSLVIPIMLHMLQNTVSLVVLAREFG